MFQRATRFVACLVPALAIFAAGQAVASDFSCLNDGETAIPEIEAAKRVLIDGEVDRLFEVMDREGLFTDDLVSEVSRGLNFAFDGGKAAFCIPVQRNDFSENFVSELFMLRTPRMFLYFAIYAFRVEEDWTVIRFEFNSSMTEMDNHLR